MQRGVLGAGVSAVKFLMDEWELGVTDAPGTAHFGRIDEYIHGGDALAWYWADPYPKMWQRFAWCGAFVAAGWGSVGLEQKLRESFFSSTVRLHCYARYRQAVKGGYRDPSGLKAQHKAGGSPRLVQELKAGKELAWLPQFGDILLGGHVDEKAPWGHHVMVCAGVDLGKGVLFTVEGNAVGRSPAGKHEGVILADRELPTKANAGRFHVLQVIRPSFYDLRG